MHVDRVAASAFRHITTDPDAPRPGTSASAGEPKNRVAASPTWSSASAGGEGNDPVGNGGSLSRGSVFSRLSHSVSRLSRFSHVVARVHSPGLSRRETRSPHGEQRYALAHRAPRSSCQTAYSRCAPSASRRQRRRCARSSKIYKNIVSREFRFRDAEPPRKARALRKFCGD